MTNFKLDFCITANPGTFLIGYKCNASLQQSSLEESLQDLMVGKMSIKLLIQDDMLKFTASKSDKEFTAEFYEN